MSIKMSEGEREAIRLCWGTGEAIPQFERILAARLAAVQAERDSARHLGASLYGDALTRAEAAEAALDTTRRALAEVEGLPWGDMPYDSKTPAEVVHDYVMVRGDLSAQYARDQLAGWIERYAEHARTCEHGVTVAELCTGNDRLVSAITSAEVERDTARRDAERLPEVEEAHGTAILDLADANDTIHDLRARLGAVEALADEWDEDLRRELGAKTASAWYARALRAALASPSDQHEGEDA